MRLQLRLPILAAVLFQCCTMISGQDQYSNYKTMYLKAQGLARDYPALCSVKSLVRTAGGKDILVITIGTGDRDNKPGIAVLGGIEGSHILGKELAAGFASTLLKESGSDDVKNLLGKITFYVFPDVSPDATEEYFADLKYERNINARSTDDDRDFLYDEDPYEDLNKDGYITLVRIKDPSGKFKESNEDKRIMVIADLSKGEHGEYQVYSEGVDNDKDGSFNEDGAGGVNFNRNFTFNYEEFGLNAGMYPVSEPETKAVADYLFDRFNIYAVFAFGPQDNLGMPLKSGEKPGTERKVTTVTKSDEIINILVSDKYHEITGAIGAPTTTTPQGNFMEWAYYHYGRYSFSTPGWWYPAEKGKNLQISFLKFAEKNNIADVMVPWTEIVLPDNNVEKTEIGGIKPFSMINPPSDTLGELINKHYKFVTAVASMHPELEFLDLKTENQGEDIFRISVKLHNKGIFSTCVEIGESNNWTRIMRISLEPSKGQVFLSGRKTSKIERLDGDESVEFSWLLKGKGTAKLTAGALNTGTVSATIDLK